VFVHCLSVGGLAGKARSTSVAAPILREQIGPVLIEGVIVEIGASERRRGVRLDVRTLDGLTPLPIVSGDHEFHRDAWFQQLGGVGFPIGNCERPAMRPPANVVGAGFVWLGAVRRAQVEFVYKASSPEGDGVSAAMVSGDRCSITPEDAEVRLDAACSIGARL
jgi:competence protein ComEC